ncbi:MAG: type III polyketide synthase [Cyclobacteriaceae bacterium]|nr:type III polyketide synthase [Cyclobacteriaceae bacterium]MDW8330783.1 type III polyketide synthase [Cyclobacteriaceae bacterium]
MAFITSIGTAVPQHRFSQETLAGFMSRAMELAPGDERKLRTIFRASGIAWRHSVLSDYGKTSDYTFYTDGFDPFPTTQQRLDVYRQHACRLSLSAIDNCLHNTSFSADQITHLIVVSCTGMYAPGLDIDLVHALNLQPSVNRLCINFMGCYAAFTALKAAHAYCATRHDARVLIVCTELCSLHFQREGTEDNLLANALFADGAAAVLVTNHPATGVNFRLKQFNNMLAVNGTEHMAWNIGNAGFIMKLSGYVPDLIRSGIGTLTQQLLKPMQKQVADIPYFAIHPGGKRILEVIEEQLRLRPEQNAPAYRVLHNYGNMSSPTVLFVLKELRDTLSRNDHGKAVMSFAFGPGLTLESMVLEIECA